jgi:hypothetical protein
VKSFEIGWREAIGIVPFVLIILVLAVFPQFGLRRSQATVKATVPPGVTATYAATPAGGTP